MTALPTDERLWCTCGRELAITEIAGRLTLSHKTNPTYEHHYPKVIRLARSEHDARAPRSTAPGPAATRARSEGPATRREDVSNADPSDRRSLREPRGARESVPVIPSLPLGARRGRGQPPQSPPARTQPSAGTRSAAGEAG